MIASSNSVARWGGQIFEPAPPHIDAALANRSPRFVARWFEVAFILMPFASPFDASSLEK
jgi:hypothetical protein